MKRKLKGVYIPCEGIPKAMEIDNTLKALQNLVGGYIEIVTGKYHNVICNENGIFLRLKPNKNINGFVGDVFLISSEIGGDGEMIGFSDDELKEVIRKFAYKKYVFER